MEEKKLEELTIEGTVFLINEKEQRLEQKDFRWNRMEFTDMVRNGDKLFFQYDPNFRNIHFPLDSSQNVKWIGIDAPQLPIGTQNMKQRERKQSYPLKAYKNKIGR